MKKTYKPYETEELFDYYFFRPIASIFVRLLINTSISPNHITISTLFFGFIIGFLIYDLNSLFYRILLIFFIIVINTFDCIDGQLARARNVKNIFGRILDGIVDYLIFACIYISIGLHFDSNYLDFYSLAILPSWIIWPIILIAVISHSMQSAYFDHYRNEYLKYVFMNYEAEGISSHKIKEDINKAKKENAKWISIFFLKIYYFYTSLQNLITRQNKFLYKSEFSSYFGSIYQMVNKSIIRLWSFLGSTSHVVYLLIFISFDRLDLYLWFEIIILNILMFFLKIHQSKINISMNKLMIIN